VVAIRPCHLRVIPIALIITVVTGCATSGLFVSDAPAAVSTKQQQAEDTALMESLDLLLAQWWKEIHPCEGIQPDQPPAMLVSVPSSVMGHYLWSRLQRAAPKNLQLTVTSGTLSTIFGSSSGDMSLRSMQQSGDGWMSISVERQDTSMDITLSALAWNELALCFSLEDMQAGSLPVAFKTITVEADRFLRGVSERIAKNSDMPLGVLQVESVYVDPGVTHVWDSVPLPGEDSLLPDLQVCVMVTGDEDIVCSPISFDTMAAKISLPVPPGYSHGFTVTVLNIDARGNVPYPPNSPYNGFLGRAKFPGLPPEVLVQGRASFSSNGLSIGLSYTLPQIPDKTKTGAPKGRP